MPSPIISVVIILLPTATIIGSAGIEVTAFNVIPAELNNIGSSELYRESEL